MKDIIHQILLIPGIAGVLAYSSEGSLLAHDFPTIYDEGMLVQMVKTLSCDTIIMQGFEENFGTLDLKFAKGRVIIKAFRGGMFFTLCASNVNVQLLGLALTQASRRLGMALETLHSEKASPGVTVTASSRGLTAGPVLPHAATIIEGVKRSLIKLMGPLGSMVFDSVYADWAAESAPTRKGLEDLLIRLAREFDEPPKQTAFINLARPLLD